MIDLDSPKVKEKCIFKKKLNLHPRIQQHLNDIILYTKGVGQEENLPTKLQKDHHFATLDLMLCF